MQDIRRAEFVRWVNDDEELDDVVNQARAETWRQHREHALLEIGQRLALVIGGRDGIQLMVNEQGRVVIEIAGRVEVVDRVPWHTHPIATGPSDADREVLRVLGQPESRLYEPRSPSGGVRFFRDSKGGAE